MIKLNGRYSAHAKVGRYSAHGKVGVRTGDSVLFWADEWTFGDSSKAIQFRNPRLFHISLLTKVLARRFFKYMPS